MTMPDHYIDRVARGAALLDEHLPGWTDEIDLDDLDLENPCLCVLGQVGFTLGHANREGGTFSLALDHLYSKVDSKQEFDFFPYDYGFDACFDSELDGTEDKNQAYAWLDETWRALIDDRKEGCR